MLFACNRQEEELARKKQQQEEEERRLEQQRRQTEALRRLQEQQQQRTKAAPWSQQTPGTGSNLADIQRQEKEKKEVIIICRLTSKYDRLSIVFQVLPT